MPSTLLPNIGGHLELSSTSSPNLEIASLPCALTTCSKLSLQGVVGGPTQGGTVPHWGGLLQPQSPDKVGCFKSHFLFLWQEDLDCSILSCYHGNLEVVFELAVRQKVDLHTVKEVCIRTHVQSWIVMDYNYIVVNESSNFPSRLLGVWPNYWARLRGKSQT